MSARMTILRSLTVSLALFGLAGCGGGPKDQPTLHPVHGAVTLDSQPLPNARVTFTPAKGPSSAAVTDEAGKYTLMHRSGEKGAVEGTHTVEVSTDLEGKHTKDAEKVPAKFNTQTNLSFIVKKGDNEYDIPLTSK
ncbi:MAG: hypothetical protein IT428_01880 [Planctomycetaceae bacterium]|nr:hypothetical protein [Planctomycetaceae bacterium]